jgi:DNA-binding beta-propeller fold protein YncE
MNRLFSFVSSVRQSAGKRPFMILWMVLLAVAGLASAHRQRIDLRVGKQGDGSYIVSTEQRIQPGALAFNGRPIDMALHPTIPLIAVLNQNSVMLLSPRGGVIPGSTVMLRRGAGFRGAIWTPDGTRLFVSLSDGWIQELKLQNRALTLGTAIRIAPEGARRNPRPGGMAITRDGSRLFVAAADRNAVAEIDLVTNRWVREYPVENLPFEVKLSEDEKTLVVTNWGGREVTDDDEHGQTGNAVIVVDPRGVAASGTVCLIRRDRGETKRLKVGLHPTAIAIQGDRAFITNAASDSLTEIEIQKQRVVRTIPLNWGRMHLFGSMPCALTIRDGIAYVCNGGDNAVCEVDLAAGVVLGFRPAGYYPLALGFGRTGRFLYVLNTKGNGSVSRTNQGLPGNAHDFQGTVSVLDLSIDLSAATARVASDNGWTRDRSSLRPRLAVYDGAIKHVLYIIKENRSYDEILGDMPQGNGDPKLCMLGENLTPNHHALARQFTLFDNAYVAGTNSADGHQWCTQALANDYIEHFYTGYRTYPFGGDCAMTLSSGGCLWDAALKKGRTIRNYGEFCDARLASFTPHVKSWMDLWKDRADGKNAIQVRAGTRVGSLRPYLCRSVIQWPLLQSDQQRADVFISEYQKFSKADQVPNLMFLTLPCDHTEGRNPSYPKPQCMVADNDLALGRVVEAVSHSPQWKNTCIFVIEDDAQFGRDHVDGHRTVYYALSPYTRRRYVDHELCNTVSMVRSIELMLGLDPMNRFDALTPPLAGCFTDTPDLTPYAAVPNRIRLDEMNPPPRFLRGQARLWTERSLALDWSDLDRADPQKLNEIVAYTLQSDGIFALPPRGPSAYTRTAAMEEPEQRRKPLRDDD